MPEALRITLIVVGSVIGVWLLLLVVNIIFVESYSFIFKKHKKALTVILYTKLENMKKIFLVVNQSGLKIDNRLNSLLSDIGPKDFDEPGSKEFDKSKNTLSYLKDEIMFVTNQHPDLESDNEFIQAKNGINEADAMYRSNIVMYNADVLGYNYWIRFFPCAFVFKLLKFKKKQIIS